MKKKIGSAILFIMLIVQTGNANASGTDITLRWWNDMRIKVSKYGNTLNDFYQRVDRNGEQFCQVLVEKYPGSICRPGSLLGGPGGTWALDQNTNMDFDENWQITSMATKSNGILRIYYFDTKNTGDDGMVEMSTESRKVVFRFFGRPEKPIFTMAHIPEMAEQAKTVAKLREPPFKNRNLTLVGVLNDVYMGRLATADYPIDQVAELLLTNPDFQETVIKEAQGLYAGAE